MTTRAFWGAAKARAENMPRRFFGRGTVSPFFPPSALCSRWMRPLSAAGTRAFSNRADKPPESRQHRNGTEFAHAASSALKKE
jgi:hypothetical protein